MSAVRLPLIELHLFPSVSYLSLAFWAGGLRLEASENFQKGSFRNRFRIASASGPMELSAPLRGGKHQCCPIRSVELANDEDWRRHHWRAIETAYRAAPFWLHFADRFEPFFKGPAPERLWDFSFSILEKTLQLLDFQGSIELTETFERMDELDFRGAIAPKKSSRPAGFRPVRYGQMFEDRLGFLPDLSALDLLFCQGKMARDILKRSWKAS